MSVFYGSPICPSYCKHSTFNPSNIPLFWHFIFNLIYLIIDFAGTLLLVKANNIFPLELVVCEIYFAFHIILWFFKLTAMGIDLTSSRIRNYGFKCTAISISVSGYLHFSLILYLNTNSILLALVYIV